MPRIFAVSNRKGGTGKTTTAVNLAAALGDQEGEVLLVDLDPQSNATIWMGIDPSGEGAFDLIDHEKSPSSLARPSDAGGIDVIPATKQMTKAERLLEMETAGQNQKLAEALEGEIGRWDYVFIDCPANFGRVTMNAMVAATDLIIPIEASDMALDGTADLLEVFQDIRQYHNSDLQVTGFLVCQVDHRTNHAADVVEMLREKFGDYVFETTIAQNVAVRDSYRHETPTVFDQPEARASREYLALAREINNS